MKYREEEVIELIGIGSISELRIWVREGWIVPSEETGELMFDDIDVARARLICQLKDDCDLTPDTMPVILSLIDQIHGLRRELKTLAKIVEDEPDDIRKRILAAWRSLSAASD